MLRLRRPTPDALRVLASRHATDPLTYEPRGGTLRGEMPDGYGHDDVAVPLGEGPACQERAARALRAWAPQRGTGLVVSSGAEVERDAVVALAAPLPIGWAVAVCRVVEVIDEDRRFGFAYGTLPEHPETGEELFLVERDDDDQVWFRIVVFSRPHQLSARLAAPLARLLQQRALRSYLTSMQQAVAD